MLFLFEFVPVNPHFTGVFFSSDLLVLLTDFVVQLLALDFVLFFQRPFLDAKFIAVLFGDL